MTSWAGLYLPPMSIVQNGPNEAYVCRVIANWFFPSNGIKSYFNGPLKSPSIVFNMNRKLAPQTQSSPAISSLNCIARLQVRINKFFETNFTKKVKKQEIAAWMNNKEKLSKKLDQREAFYLAFLYYSFMPQFLFILCVYCFYVNILEF